MGELTRKGETRPVTREDLALYEQGQAIQQQQRPAQGAALMH